MLSYLRTHVWSLLPERITRRQCAWAALFWGGALLVLGGWLGRAAWREGAPWPSDAKLAAAGGVLLAAALLIPGVGERVYLTVLRVAAIVGWIVGRILLSAVFYLLITPMGWAMRLKGKDPLELDRRKAPPRWIPHSGRADRKRYYRLF